MIVHRIVDKRSKLVFPIEHDVNDFTLQLAVIVTIYMTLLAREKKLA